MNVAIELIILHAMPSKQQKMKLKMSASMSRSGQTSADAGVSVAEVSSLDDTETGMDQSSADPGAMVPDPPVPTEAETDEVTPAAEEPMMNATVAVDDEATDSIPPFTEGLEETEIEATEETLPTLPGMNELPTLPGQMGLPTDESPDATNSTTPDEAVEEEESGPDEQQSDGDESTTATESLAEEPTAEASAPVEETESDGGDEVPVISGIPNDNFEDAIILLPGDTANG